MRFTSFIPPKNCIDYSPRLFPPSRLGPSPLLAFLHIPKTSSKMVRCRLMSIKIFFHDFAVENVVDNFSPKRLRSCGHRPLRLFSHLLLTKSPATSGFPAWFAGSPATTKPATTHIFRCGQPVERAKPSTKGVGHVKPLFDGFHPVDNLCTSVVQLSPNTGRRKLDIPRIRGYPAERSSGGPRDTSRTRASR